MASVSIVMSRPARLPRPESSERPLTTAPDLSPHPRQRAEIPMAQREGARPGEILDGRYELLHLLGTGGMGLVYAARHVVLGTRVAVKILRDGGAGDRVAAERFRREARAASAIGHPGIIQVRDFGTTPDGRSYLVMEHVEGRDLADEIVERGVLPAPRAARIGARIASAVGAAHAHGIVHRDLKPENVLLVDQGPSEALPEGSVKVLDFGIAKVSGAAELVGSAGGAAIAPPERITALGQLLGTPEYMSPEQCRGAAVGPESDVYSLGVMLYEMSTGMLPFEAATPMELVRLHLEAAPRSPRDLEPGLPGSLVTIIERCLQKRPQDRFRSMRELEAALVAMAPPLDRAAAAGFRVPLETPRAIEVLAAEPSRAPRHRSLAVAGVTVSIAIAGAALVALALALAHPAAPSTPPVGTTARREVESASSVSVTAPAAQGAIEGPRSLDHPAHVRSAAAATPLEPAARTPPAAEPPSGRSRAVPRDARRARARRPPSRSVAPGGTDTRTAPAAPSAAAPSAASVAEREPEAPRSRILDQFLDPWADPG